MWNDRPAKRPVVGMVDSFEEMDVCLSLREYRELLAEMGPAHVTELLSGNYELSPYVSVRMADDWFLKAEIDAVKDEEDGA